MFCLVVSFLLLKNVRLGWREREWQEKMIEGGNDMKMIEGEEGLFLK